MNKIILLVVFYTVFAIRAYSQAVVSGNFEAGAGAGFGIFQVSHNDSSSENAIGVSGILQGHFNYAAIDNLSLGVLFQRNGFVTERDSGNSVQTWLPGASVHYRVINAESTTVYFGLTGGPSWIHFYHNGSKNYVDGKGYWFDLVAGTRFFISDITGFFVELSYNKQHFTNFYDKDNNLLMVGPVNGRREYMLNLGGMNLRLGLNFKFGKK